MNLATSFKKTINTKKKKYKFDLKIDKICISDDRKTFLRVVWIRGNKDKKGDHKVTNWYEGIGEFVITDLLSCYATMRFNKKTNKIKSKSSKLEIQTMNRRNTRRKSNINTNPTNTIATIPLDLSRYIDVKTPGKPFSECFELKESKKIPKIDISFEIRGGEALDNDGGLTDTDIDNDVDMNPKNNLQLISGTKHSYTNQSHRKQGSALLLTKTSMNNNNLHVSESKSNQDPLITQSHVSLTSNENVSEEKPKKIKQETLKLDDSKEEETKYQNENIKLNGKHSKKHHRSKKKRKHIHRTKKSPSMDGMSFSSENSRHSIVKSFEGMKEIEDLRDRLLKYEQNMHKYEIQCKEIEELKRKIEEHELSESVMRDEITHLKMVEDDLYDKKGCIAELENVIEKLTRQNEELKKALQEKNEMIIKLNKDNEQLSIEIEKLTTLESENDEDEVKDEKPEIEKREFNSLKQVRFRSHTLAAPVIQNKDDESRSPSPPIPMDNLQSSPKSVISTGIISIVSNDFKSPLKHRNRAATFDLNQDNPKILDSPIDENDDNNSIVSKSPQPSTNHLMVPKVDSNEPIKDLSPSPSLLSVQSNNEMTNQLINMLTKMVKPSFDEISKGSGSPSISSAKTETRQKKKKKKDCSKMITFNQNGKEVKLTVEQAKELLRQIQTRKYLKEQHKKHKQNSKKTEELTTLLNYTNEMRKQQASTSENMLAKVHDDWLKSEQDKIKLKKDLENEKSQTRMIKTQLESSNMRLSEKEAELNALKDQFNWNKSQYDKLEEQHVKLKHDYAIFMDKYNSTDIKLEKLKKELKKERELNKKYLAQSSFNPLQQLFTLTQSANPLPKPTNNPNKKPKPKPRTINKTDSNSLKKKT